MSCTGDSDPRGWLSRDYPLRPPLPNGPSAQPLRNPHAAVFFSNRPVARLLIRTSPIHVVKVARPVPGSVMAPCQKVLWLVFISVKSLGVHDNAASASVN